MIDPASSLSIACAIAQFIDFSAGVIKRARELQRTKCTVEEIASLEQDAKHLLDLCEALCGDRADKAGGTKTSQALAGIAGRCQNIADEMIKLLGKFKVSGDSSKRSLLKIAIKIQLGSGELEQCERRLVATKTDLCLHLLGTSGIVYQTKFVSSRNIELTETTR